MQENGTDTGAWRGKAALALLGCAIFSATLWDFRIYDLRIFDGVSILSLAGFLLLNHRSFEGWLRERRDYLFLFAVIIIYAALGYALHLHRSSLAIIVFAALALQLIAQPGWSLSARFYRPLVIVHLAAFFFQYLTFMLFDYLADFHALYGQNSRLLNGVQFKPAGLFQEANSFCLNMFILATLAILYRPDRVLIGAAALSMALSGSLWGLAAAVVVILMNEARVAGTGTGTEKIRGFVVSIVVVFVALNVHLWIEKPPDKSMPYLYARIANVFSDAAVRDRYVEKAPRAATQECTGCDEPGTYRIPQPYAWITGEGLSTKYFLKELPANGIHFLIKSFGALGLLLLAASLVIALRALPVADKLFIAASIGFAFTTYPLVTYMIFWLWWPSLIVFARAGLFDRNAPGRLSA